MINSTEYIRLVSFLKNFDCNPREASTYIECLQIGTGSVQEIAKRLNSNRVTIHSTIEQLIKKGLLFATIKGKKRYIVAEPPDVLSRILQKKSNDLKLIEKDLDQMTKSLYSIQNPEQASWNVRVYEDSDSLKKIMEETFSSKSSICILASGEKFVEQISAAYLNDYYKRLAEGNVHTRIICTAKHAEIFKENLDKYHLQYAISTPLSQFQICSFIWNDHLALISFQDNGPVCTVLKSPELSAFFREYIFEKIWKQSSATSNS